MSSRGSRVGGRSVAGVAISLAIHGLFAALALSPGNGRMVATGVSDRTIFAELLQLEPGSPGGPRGLARLALRPTRRAPAEPWAASSNSSDPLVVTSNPFPDPVVDEAARAAVAPPDSLDSPAPAPTLAEVVPAPPGASPAAVADGEAQPAETAGGTATSTAANAPNSDDSKAPLAQTEAQAVPVPGEGREVSPAVALPAAVPPEQRSLLEEVAGRAAVSARAEAEPFLAKRAVFEFLLDHPEFATHLTRALKLGRYRIWQTPDGLLLDDGWGSTGQLAVLHRAAGTRIMYARGQYEPRLLPEIRGEAVVVIEYDFQPVGDGRDLVSTAITSYVTLDSRALALVAKFARGAATRKVDLESRKLVRNFARVSRAIDENPEAVVAQLRQRPDVPSRELEEFTALLGHGGPRHGPPNPPPLGAPRQSRDAPRESATDRGLDMAP